MPAARRGGCCTIAPIPLQRPRPAMTDTPAPPTTEDAPVLYRILADEVPAGSALTTLHIGGAHTTLASGHAAQAPLLLRTLDLGARVTAATRFAHQPPLPDELQAAGDAAQQAFAPLRERLALQSSLYTTDAGVRQIALAAGLEAQPELLLPLSALEALYQRLLQPGSDAEPGELAAPHFAAAVVILRACLLALGFDSITIRSDAAA